MHDNLEKSIALGRYAGHSVPFAERQMLLHTPFHVSGCAVVGNSLRLYRSDDGHGQGSTSGGHLPLEQHSSL